MQVAIWGYPPALMLKRSTSMSIYYTYLLKHIPTNTFYYGVRFAEGCHPDEFWKTYFTSSKKKIPELREQYGDDSFEFQIRRTFIDRQKAVDWESKVLRRMKVLKFPEIWLNRTDNRAILNEVGPNKGKPLPESTKKVLKEQTGNKNTQYGSQWWTNGVDEIKIAKNKLPPENWKRGRIHRPPIQYEQIFSKGKSRPDLVEKNKSRIFTKEIREKMRNSRLAYLEKTKWPK